MDTQWSRLNGVSISIRKLWDKDKKRGRRWKHRGEGDWCDVDRMAKGMYWVRQAKRLKARGQPEDGKNGHAYLCGNATGGMQALLPFSATYAVVLATGGHGCRQPPTASSLPPWAIPMSTFSFRLDVLPRGYVWCCTPYNTNCHRSSKHIHHMLLDANHASINFNSNNSKLWNQVVETESLWDHFIKGRRTFPKHKDSERSFDQQLYSATIMLVAK